MIRLEYVHGDHVVRVEVDGAPGPLSGFDSALVAWSAECDMVRHLRPNPDRPGVSITWDDPAATLAEAERALETARRVFEEENRARSADERARRMAEGLSEAIPMARAGWRWPLIGPHPCTDEEAAALVSHLDEARQDFFARRSSEEPATDHTPADGEVHEVQVGDPDSQHRPTVRWRYAEVADRIFGEAQAADEAEAHRWPHPPLDQVAEARRRDEEEAKLAELAELPGTPPAAHLRDCAPCRRMAERKAAQREEGRSEKAAATRRSAQQEVVDRG